MTKQPSPNNRLNINPNNSEVAAPRGMIFMPGGRILSGGAALARNGPPGSGAGGVSDSLCEGAAANTAKKAKCKNGRKNSPAQKGWTPMSRNRRADSDTPAATNGMATANSTIQYSGETPGCKSGLTLGETYINGFHSCPNLTDTSRSSGYFAANRQTPAIKYCKRVTRPCQDHKSSACLIGAL